jgi:PAS domain S-box-containing protein
MTHHRSPPTVSDQFGHLRARLVELEWQNRQLRQGLQTVTSLALERSEERTRQLLAASPDCLLELDLDGNLLSINARGAELLELARPEDLLGRPWSAQWPAERRADVEAALASARHGRPARFQGPSTTVAGTLRWWDVHVLALIGPVGRPDRLLAAARDITLLRQAEEERQRFERNLLETHKLESLGVLAGGIAHDFNNLLTGILGNTELVLLSTPADSPSVPHLEQVIRATERAAELCRQMLAYAGKGRLVVEPLDLGVLVNDTTRRLKMTLSKKATLTVCLAPNLPAVRGDATQLRQVLMNLVTNANEALEGSEGLIAITTRLRRVDRTVLAEAHLGLDRAEGEYLCLEVGDTGCGMDEATRARIFEPFFTTKFTGRGLGLAAVLGIVRGHGGLLRVSSRPGQGSTFQLFFPPCAEVARPVPPAAPEPPWRGHGTVLLVDDEETVRDALASDCWHLGFDVLHAGDGWEALRVLARHGTERIGVVLLDWTMPRLDGGATLREIRQLAPDLPVVVMSAYSEQELADHFADQNVAGFLPKPFTLETVRHRLRQALS